jgi:hypothetical protein
MSEKDQARRDRPKAGPFVQNRLREEIERLETARAWRDGDRNAITLTKGTDLGRNGPTNRRSVLELESCPASGEKEKWRILPVGEVHDQRAALQGGHRRNTRMSLSPPH